MPELILPLFNEFRPLEDAYLRARVNVLAQKADVPVEQASNYELVINPKTAETLGITIPRRVLSPFGAKCRDGVSSTPCWVTANRSPLTKPPT